MFTKHIYLFLHSIIYFVIYFYRGHARLLRKAFDDNDASPPSYALLIPLQKKNQTALKQIDVLFNTVVTSSQGLCVVCLGDNCRAAQLSRHGYCFVGRFNDLSQKKKKKRKKDGERERKEGPLD